MEGRLYRYFSPRTDILTEAPKACLNTRRHVQVPTVAAAQLQLATFTANAAVVQEGTIEPLNAPNDAEARSTIPPRLILSGWCGKLDRASLRDQFLFCISLSLSTDRSSLPSF